MFISNVLKVIPTFLVSTKQVQIQFTTNCLRGLFAHVDDFEQLRRLSLRLIRKHDVDVLKCFAVGSSLMFVWLRSLASCTRYERCECSRSNWRCAQCVSGVRFRRKSRRALAQSKSSSARITLSQCLGFQGSRRINKAL